MTLTPGTKLGPYEVLSALGAGGMGEVYRARDSKLRREVAIKVLPESLARDADALARFEREALAVAALSHPNILAIFDFGAQDGVTYAVMELLEGGTLRDKLDAGPIPPRQTVDYALQIAKGLSAAHEKGIVHRDLKPENIFIAKDGHLKILDFGLAKRTDREGSGDGTSAPTTSRATGPGTVMGTVGYMSPEQVKGLAVDQRSDIFSFGAILYEMLSGRKAFKKDSAAETIAAILKEEPPELSQSGRSIPPALDRVVKHCLEKSREERFQSARDIGFALGEASAPVATGGAAVAPMATKNRRLIAAAVIVVLVAAGAFFLPRSTKRGGEAGGVKRVAVLPFENLGSPEDDYFADGIADEVRGKLTSLPGLEVIARSSSTPYKRTTKTPKVIAEELNVSYLLTATVRWEKGRGASRVHVSPELVDVSRPDAPISKWQQPFDAALTDVFQVQSDIASRVGHALGLVLGIGDEKRLSEKPTQNLEAYEAFLKGEEASQGMAANDAPSLRRAIGFFEQAVVLDPSFAQAWGDLGRANMNLYAYSSSSPDVADRAHQAAERAVALAPDRPEGHLAVGGYRRWVLNDIPGALEEYSRAHRVAPGETAPLIEMAQAKWGLGRWEEALSLLLQADRLDPRSVAVVRWLSIVLHWMRRYQEAHEAEDRGLALAPANLSIIQFKAMTFLDEGNLSGARETLHAAEKHVDSKALISYMASHWDVIWAFDPGQLDLLLRLTPGDFDDKVGWGLSLARGYALRGDKEKVRLYAGEVVKMYEERARSDPKHFDDDNAPGLAYAHFGRKADAIRVGETAVSHWPVSRDAFWGPITQYALVRIYLLVGEPEKALDQLEPLLKIPFVISPAWLRIDPTFDSLRENPRFQKLVAGK